jgi:hypothetical protein
MNILGIKYTIHLDILLLIHKLSYTYYHILLDC